MPAPTSPFLRPHRLAVLCCAALEKEISIFREGLSHIVAVDILEMNLHEAPAQLRVVLQEKINTVETAHQTDAIALVYGLCGCGLAGLRAGNCPIVVPRAHDCVTLFLGDKERYAQLNKEQPETYWFTPGWNSTGRAPGPEKLEKMKDDLSQKFDEEEVEYLIEEEMKALKIYQKAAYIDLGVGDSAANEAYAKKCAEWIGWKFERRAGDQRLLLDLLAGTWDEERFLVVPPGHEIRPSVDAHIMKAVPIVATP